MHSCSSLLKDLKISEYKLFFNHFAIFWEDGRVVEKSWCSKECSTCRNPSLAQRSYVPPGGIAFQICL